MFFGKIRVCYSWITHWLPYWSVRWGWAARWSVPLSSHCQSVPQECTVHKPHGPRHYCQSFWVHHPCRGTVHIAADMAVQYRKQTTITPSMCLHRQLTNHVQPAKYKCNTWALLCNILCEVEYFNTHHSSRTFLTLTFPTKPWACWYCYNSVTRCKENGYKSDFYMELITFKSAMQP